MHVARAQTGDQADRTRDFGAAGNPPRLAERDRRGSSTQRSRCSGDLHKRSLVRDRQVWPGGVVFCAACRTAGRTVRGRAPTPGENDRARDYDRERSDTIRTSHTAYDTNGP